METFETIIQKNIELSNAEKFIYLQSFFKSFFCVFKVIDGLILTHEN